MSDPSIRSVENSEIIQRARAGRLNFATCPVQSGAGTWCYDRIKRSTSKIRIQASFAGRTEFDRNTEFQKLVDTIKGDSLLECAVVEFGWDTSTVTFRNGSVIEFII